MPPTVIAVLCAAFLLLMQAGLALVFTGLCRARSAGQIVLGNLVIGVSAVLGFWICGHALMFGVKMFHAGTGNAGDGHGFLVAALLTALAAVIPSGAMAERWSIRSMVWYGLFAGMLPAALMGRWIWGGGWLADLGATASLGHGVVDFAGAGVVHLSGAMIALAGASALGPRVGKYARDGRPRPMPGHNLVFVSAGTLILFAGWIGFNSARAGSGERLEMIAVNTLLAGVAGAIAAYATTVGKFSKPDPSMVCNGLLAGLVAISASCAFVNSFAAVLIGAVAGFGVVNAVLIFEGKLKIDDPVGVISVHGFGGAWGLLSLGLFADGSAGAGLNAVAGPDGVCGGLGKQFGGPANDWAQLAAQAIGVVVIIVCCWAAGWIWFKASNRFVPIRVRRDFEINGLDLPETGAECYPDFHLTDKGGGGASFHP